MAVVPFASGVVNNNFDVVYLLLNTFMYRPISLVDGYSFRTISLQCTSSSCLWRYRFISTCTHHH